MPVCPGSLVGIVAARMMLAMTIGASQAMPTSTNQATTRRPYPATAGKSMGAASRMPVAAPHAPQREAPEASGVPQFVQYTAMPILREPGCGA
jgi:hypothetical protein